MSTARSNGHRQEPPPPQDEATTTADAFTVNGIPYRIMASPRGLGYRLSNPFYDWTTLFETQEEAVEYANQFEGGNVAR
jgi:hypothetical protein